MILEKVYDELYGMIEDLKKKIQAAEKSDVTITPALESGTKIADFEIDGTEGSIYAPDPNVIFDSFDASISIAANSAAELAISSTIAKEGYNVKMVTVYSVSSTIMPVIEYANSNYYILARNFSSSSAETTIHISVSYEKAVTQNTRTKTTKKK